MYRKFTSLAKLLARWIAAEDSISSHEVIYKFRSRRCEPERRLQWSSIVRPHLQACRQAAFEWIGNVQTLGGHTRQYAFIAKSSACRVGGG